jgi:cyclase
MPCLLLKDGSLVKTIQFKDPSYVGDPINTIRIYNDKEVDELIVVDIAATVENKEPNFPLLREIASECFMPVTYGGAVQTLKQVETIFRLGIEKVAVNSYAFKNPQFVRAIASAFGNQSVVISIDVKKNLWGQYKVYARGGREATGLDPVEHAVRMEEMGAGEILLTSIDRDGTMQGYDLDLIRRVAGAVHLPVIACGGAGRVADFGEAVKQGGASAAAAGSMVVYYGRNRAVLINFPTRREIMEALA